MTKSPHTKVKGFCLTSLRYLPVADEWIGQLPATVSQSNKKVVVVGLGATAMTLVRSMAKTAEYLTMLQRSPTYVNLKS